VIEAELKARVRDVEAVQRWLRERASEEPATYHDTYYDWPDHRLDAEGREIRLRTIETPDGTTHLLTYKQPPVDEESGSKPEFETTVAERLPINIMLLDLGLAEQVSLTKRCQNYCFEYGGRPIQATIVNIAELEGTFIEVETQSDRKELTIALASIRKILDQLGVGDDMDQRSYTASVIEERSKSGRDRQSIVRRSR
jgi:adenylate cyclase, class 2